ncbi:NAD kinase [Dysgonomonas sp. 216]|uniref:NAD kinase n=1 Tax=Dysgonomonas sp. 216 TaxID=2302934 RepID=UPI0013D4945A|nr:NAD kinase [Dysgonomonas sp. 216]NDW17482.1 NAD kinase [Dysgonomonas sp. 216]
MKIAIFGSQHQKKGQIKRILDILSENNVEISMHKKFYDYLHLSFGVNYQIAEFIDCENFSADMAFSIGGDGTFLRTASIVGGKDIPILGVNAGRLGFLADISDKDLDATLEELMLGQYRIEERSQLMLTTKDKSFKEYNYALNEVAIMKQDTASMLTLHANINDEYLTSYQADGLIVATPTGSTAYSLSVGGPIMTPNSSNFILAPIAPHSLTTRPLVVEDDSVLTFDVESRNRSFLVSLDGRSDVLTTGTRLEVKKGDYPLKVVKRIGHTFYETLRDKLKWGADSRFE